MSTSGHLLGTVHRMDEPISQENSLSTFVLSPFLSAHSRGEAHMDKMFFVTLEDGLWMIKTAGQYIGGSGSRAEAIEFAIRKAEARGFETQVLVAGKDRMFQTVWAGGRTYNSTH